MLAVQAPGSRFRGIGRYCHHLVSALLALDTEHHSLLAISEATRADCRYLTGLAADRVVNISGATDPDLFVPDETFPIPFATRRDLQRLGISRPYLFSVASMDDRKNLWGLIDAFR